jgi:hypothetical protein
MIWLIHNFWCDTKMVCWASGNYSNPFWVGRGVTQSGPLSAKLFNIVVDTVAQEWMHALREENNLGEAKVGPLIVTFFANFYVDNTYLASQDSDFLQ